MVLPLVVTAALNGTLAPETVTPFAGEVRLRLGSLAPDTRAYAVTGTAVLVMPGPS